MSGGPGRRKGKQAPRHGEPNGEIPPAAATAGSDNEEPGWVEDAFAQETLEKASRSVGTGSIGRQASKQNGHAPPATAPESPPVYDAPAADEEVPGPEHSSSSSSSTSDDEEEGTAPACRGSWNLTMYKTAAASVRPADLSGRFPCMVVTRQMSARGPGHLYLDTVCRSGAADAAGYRTRKLRFACVPLVRREVASQQEAAALLADTCRGAVEMAEFSHIPRGPALSVTMLKCVVNAVNNSLHVAIRKWKHRGFSDASDIARVSAGIELAEWARHSSQDADAHVADTVMHFLVTTGRISRNARGTLSSRSDFPNIGEVLLYVCLMSDRAIDAAEGWRLADSRHVSPQLLRGVPFPPSSAAAAAASGRELTLRNIAALWLTEALWRDCDMLHANGTHSGATLSDTCITNRDEILDITASNRTFAAVALWYARRMSWHHSPDYACEGIFATKDLSRMVDTRCPHKGHGMKDTARACGLFGFDLEALLVNVYRESGKIVAHRRAQQQAQREDVDPGASSSSSSSSYRGRPSTQRAAARDSSSK